MNLTSLKNTKNLLKEYRIFPSKRLGQNFLIDKRVIKKIIEAANLQAKDTILEVGPGLGSLTLELAKKVKKVVAVEKDQKMVELLKESTQNFKNIKIIQGDILKILRNKKEVAALNLSQGYKLVANIPYYLTSHLIRKFLELKNQPKEMVLMVQKEVAQRISAKPPDMNLLAVSVQFYAQPKIISLVSKKSFWPRPKVDSAIIKITPYKSLADELLRKKFFKIVKAGFSHPRKQILNNFALKLKLNKERVKFWLLKNKIKPEQRAEMLGLENWFSLTITFDSFLE